MKFPYKKTTRFTIRYYWLIIAVTLILTALSAITTKNLKFKGDFRDLLPEDFKSVQDLNHILERAGGEGYFLVVLETENIDKAKSFADTLVPKLEAFEEVSYIDYKFDKQFFEDRNLLYIDKEDLVTLQTRLKKKIKTEKNRINPFYIDLLGEKYEFNIDDIKEKYSSAEIKDYYITENPTRLVILLKPTGFASDLNFCKRLLAKTQATIAGMTPQTFDPSMKIKYTGRYVIRIEETEFMFEDLKRTSLFAIIGVLLVIILFTRRLLSIVFIGTPLIISIIYALAFTTLTVGNLNLITSILVGILAGMGIDFGIHLYLRYFEERRRGRSVGRSIEIVQSSTGKPVFLAGLTTAAAFYILTPTEFIGFSEFGWIAGSGVMICMINTFFLLPAMLIAREKISPITQKLELATNPIEKMHIPRKYPKPVWTVAAFALFSLFSLWGMTQLEFDYDFRKFSADKKGTLALQEEISDQFGVSLTPTVVYTENLDDIPKITQTLEVIRDNNAETTIQQGMSLHTYVPENQEEKIPEIRKLGQIAEDKTLRLLEGEELKRVDDLKRWAQVNPFTVHDLPKHLTQQYNAVNGYDGSFLFIFPEIDLWHGKDLIRFAKEIRTFADVNKDENIFVASESVIFSDILSLIKHEGPYALLGSFLIIFLFLFVDFRRFGTVLIVLSPLCISMLCLTGFMYIFGMKLNFMNVVIFPVLLGLGIDHGVHIYHRYQETGPGHLLYVVRKTGSAVFLSSITTIIGFGGLITAVHLGLNSIGLLAVAGLSLGLLASLTLLPAILQIIEDRQHGKRKTMTAVAGHPYPKRDVIPAKAGIHAP